MRGERRGMMLGECGTKMKLGEGERIIISLVMGPYRDMMNHPGGGEE